MFITGSVRLMNNIPGELHQRIKVYDQCRIIVNVKPEKCKCCRVPKQRLNRIQYVSPIVKFEPGSISHIGPASNVHDLFVLLLIILRTEFVLSSLTF